MHIKFEDGTQFAMWKNPTAESVVIAGHKRDALNVTVEAEYVAVKNAFNGQGWAIADGENEYVKSNYTLIASICDNMDGSITVRIGRQNTVEETLQDENEALAAENAEQAEIINILSGGAF